MQLLKGKKALVTGGTSGIGRAIALEFARHGANVAISGTSQERAESVCKELAEIRVAEEEAHLFYLADVASKQAVDEMISSLLAKWGGVDILVNNAGIVRDGLLMKMSEEDWSAVIDTNLKSVYNTCQALVRPMLKARRGKIINVSSVVGLTGNSGQANYAASKAGMIGFSKSLAQEVASRGICVNCIAPGFVETRMTGALSDEVKQKILQKVPMGRLGSPEDIAFAALFLASHHSDYMTGQVMTVDGGMVM